MAPVTATYSMDHTEGGKLAGEEIVKYLTKKYGTPKGNVVDLEGIAEIVAAAQREKGFADVIAKYPDIKVVARADGGFNTDGANAVMTNILPAQPNIDAVYGANDAETYGAITAIKAADRFQPVGKPGHIYAIGVDGSAPGINGIRDGSQDATVSQQFIKMSTMLIDDIHAKETGQAKDIPERGLAAQGHQCGQHQLGRCQAIRHLGGRCEVMNEPALVELRNVCKRYPGVVALDDVTLTLRAGTVTALAGENGAGKSTLIKVLSGAVRADSGEVRVARNAAPARTREM